MNKYYARDNLNDFFDRMIESYEPCPDKYDAAVVIKGASYSIPTADVRPADMRQDISNFTPEEQKTFWEAIEQKSINTGVNIHDLI